MSRHRDETAPGNPWRDPAVRIELGDRACSDLMSQADWREVLEIWTYQQGLSKS